MPKNNITRWLVIPDLHVPSHDEKSLMAVEKLMEDYRWDGCVLLGDLMDFDVISAHNHGKPRLTEGKRLAEDYKVAAKVLDRIISKVRKRNHCARVVYISGNHEYRLQRYIDGNPALEGMGLEVPLALNLRERRVEWIPFWEEGKIFKLGKVAFGHGLYTNDLHAKKHCLRYGCELFVYGHTHAIQYYSSEMHGNGTTIAAVSLGCLCEPMPYMMGRPDRWEQAVGVLEMCGGDYGFNVIRIVGHKFIYGGRVYEG